MANDIKTELKLIETDAEVQSAIVFLNGTLAHEMNNPIWTWEFKTWPKKTVLAIIKNRSNNNIIGTQFMMPAVLQIKNADVLTGKSENSHIDPILRGQGLFERLYDVAIEDCKLKGLNFLWGFTPAIKVFEKKLKFDIFENTMFNVSVATGMSRWAVVKAANKNIATAFAKFGFHFFKYCNYKFKHAAFANKIQYRKLIADFNVANEIVNWNDMEKLYEDLKKSYHDFAHIKMDKAYFDWRIANNKSQNYTTNFFYRDNILQGYYIFAKKNYSANLTDFTPLNPSVANVMVCHLLNELNSAGLSELNYFGNIDFEINRSNFSLLQNFGFKTKLTDGMPFVLKNISDNQGYDIFLSESKNWYLNGLWTEGFVY